MLLRFSFQNSLNHHKSCRKVIQEHYLIQPIVIPTLHCPSSGPRILLLFQICLIILFSYRVFAQLWTGRILFCLLTLLFYATSTLNMSQTTMCPLRWLLCSLKYSQDNIVYRWNCVIKKENFFKEATSKQCMAGSTDKQSKTKPSWSRLPKCWDVHLSESFYVSFKKYHWTTNFWVTCCPTWADKEAVRVKIDFKHWFHPMILKHGRSKDVESLFCQHVLIKIFVWNVGKEYGFSYWEITVFIITFTPDTFQRWISSGYFLFYRGEGKNTFKDIDYLLTLDSDKLLLTGVNSVRWLLNGNLPPHIFLSNILTGRPREMLLNRSSSQCGTLLVPFKEDVNQHNSSLPSSRILQATAGAFGKLENLNSEQRYLCKHWHIFTEHFIWTD